MLNAWMCCGCCTVFHDTNRQVTFLIKPQLNPLFESKVKMKMKRKKHIACSNLWIKRGRKNWTIDKNGQARMKKNAKKRKPNKYTYRKSTFGKTTFGVLRSCWKRATCIYTWEKKIPSHSRIPEWLALTQMAEKWRRPQCQNIRSHIHIYSHTNRYNKNT